MFIRPIKLKTFSLRLGAALRLPLRSCCIAAGSTFALKTRTAIDAGSAELGSQLKLPI